MDSLFLNGGAVVGEKWAYEFMIDRVQSYGAMVTCGSSEQRGLHRFYLENPNLVKLDFGSVIFKNLRSFPKEKMYTDGWGQLQLTSYSRTPKGISASDKTWTPTWQRKPCAFHGSSSGGKVVYGKLVTSWIEGLRQRESSLDKAIHIPVAEQKKQG
jgi:hypothetical protein